jgi:hypothetical protein
MDCRAPPSAPYTQRKWCFAMPNKISTATFRWIAKRKADLIARIGSGEISEAEALRLYQLSPEELAEWRRCYSEGGVCGLMEKQSFAARNGRARRQERKSAARSSRRYRI